VRIYYVNNQLYYLSGARLKNQDGKVELQIIVSFNRPEEVVSSYKGTLADRNGIQGHEDKRVQYIFAS